MTKTYLGDGVYVQFDGRGLVLSTENGIETTNAIYLEPGVYGALLDFVNSLSLWEKQKVDVASCPCHQGSVCTALCTAYHHSGCPNE